MKVLKESKLRKIISEAVDRVLGESRLENVRYYVRFERRFGHKRTWEKKYFKSRQEAEMFRLKRKEEYPSNGIGGVECEYDVKEEPMDRSVERSVSDYASRWNGF